MQYRATGNRCAVKLDTLKLPVSNDEALALLKKKGFVEVEVDVVALARECMTSSRYRRGAQLYEAPAIVDCSSFIKWLYSMRGIWLPRRSIQQREFGVSVGYGELQAGDVVFVSGYIDYFWHDREDGVGHVGVATGEGSVVHAANSTAHVIETSVDKFVGSKFRGARRYGAYDPGVITLETPPQRAVEMADDLRWIILQNLPKLV